MSKHLGIFVCPFILFIFFWVCFYCFNRSFLRRRHCEFCSYNRFRTEFTAASVGKHPLALSLPKFYTVYAATKCNQKIVGLFFILCLTLSGGVKSVGFASTFDTFRHSYTLYVQVLSKYTDIFWRLKIGVSNYCLKCINKLQA